MSDVSPGNSEDPDALPLNERSSAFIDGAAFLNFVRLKSRLAQPADSGEKTAATGSQSDGALQAAQVSHGDYAEQAHDTVAYLMTAAMDVEIQDDDWDSLFGAVEERLRDTADSLDCATTQPLPQDSLSRIKAVMLDCVDSLDALHQALRHNRRLQLQSRSDKKTSGVRSA